MRRLPFARSRGNGETWQDRLRKWSSTNRHTKQTITTALFKPNCQPGSLFISKSKFGSKVPIGERADEGRSTPLAGRNQRET